jgi:drug/metabolite transporter (DMT)-like permease
MHAVTVRAALLALLISVLWGGNIVALKFALTAIPPFWSAFWRMLIGLPLIAIWAKVQGIPLWPEPEEWRPLLVLGLLCFAQISLLNLGTFYTSAAYAVVLLNSHPIFTNLVSHYFTPGDRVSWMRTVGLLVAFGGICLVFLGRPDAHWAPRPTLGNIISTCSALFVAVRAVATKRVAQTTDPTRLIFWTLIFSIPLYLLCAVVFEALLTAPLLWKPLLGLLYQSFIVAGFCFIMWTRLLRDHPPGVISVFAFPTPIFGLIFSAFFFSERLAPPLIIGVIAVVAGILIVARTAARDHQKAAEEAEAESMVDAA